MAKPLHERDYRFFLKWAEWSLEKGSVDYNLLDEQGKYRCSIKITHAKGKRGEVSASSIRKTGKEGYSKMEVLQNYPKYLREFIKQRLDDNLSPLTESKTTGHGGKREGAGRPKGTIKEPTRRLTLPAHIADIAVWMRQHPEAIPEIRKLMRHP